MSVVEHQQSALFEHVQVERPGIEQPHPVFQQFYAVVYTSPPQGSEDPEFGETSSLLVALAATQPGYLGFQKERAAEGRTVAVCYWDSFQALSDWTDSAIEWVKAKQGLENFVCATGCLWPWLLDGRRVDLEPDLHIVA